MSLSSICLIPITEAWLFLAIRVAISMVLARNWSAGTRWFSRPIWNASSASTTRAVNRSSLALGQPTWLVRVQVQLIRP